MSITTMIGEFIFDGIASAVETDAKQLPQTLYHYTNADVLYKIITLQKLRASLITHLNDTSEYAYGLKVFSDVLQSGEIKFPDNMELFAQSLLVALKRREQGRVDAFELDSTPPDVFAFCLSENADQLSQWRAYGDNARGYSIGFESAQLQTLEPRCKLIHICYNPDVQRNNQWC